jgi:uncharacterized protein YjbI with pentapeptide repeats
MAVRYTALNTALGRGGHRLANDRKIKELLRGFFGTRAVRVVGVVAFLVVVVVLLFLILNWYVDPTKPSERKDLVLAVAQILVGTVLLSGLYFTWRTLQVNREGQITDRFTRAIDQLGKVEDGQKLFEIRLGGIYALERIARESEEDYWPIMEILTAYVRQNASLPREAGQERTQDATDEQRAMEGSGGKSETTEPSAPDPDIQAIMTILRRRKFYYRHEEPGALDLSKTNLFGADFSGANLYRANLSATDLSGADLSAANLYRAVLSGANLSGANLSRADLSRASLSAADLFGADLFGAVLFGADLSGADLIGAELIGADLSRASLSAANLSRAELIGANLSRAVLSGANLSGANLSRADLFGAVLSAADLSGAILTGFEANLTGTNLTQEQLEQAEGDENTQLPPHLKPPAHWGVKTDEQTEGE